MGTIYQRREGGPYYGYWTDTKNRHHRKSLRTRDAAVARVRLRQLELVSTDPAAHARHSLADAIGNLLDVVSHGNAAATWKAYRQKGENLVDVLGDVEIGALTRDTVLAYVRARKKAGAADGTIHKELVVLRRALAEARERGLWAGDPRAVVPSIKVRYEPRERWLTARDGARLLDEIRHPRRRLWAALAMLAGLRLSEVERARWEHVDLDTKRLRVVGRKTVSAWRIVPIGPDLERLLRAAKKRDKPRAADSIVSKWPNVRRDLHAAIARLNVIDAKLAAKRRRRPPALLQPISPNDLRRTFASWLKQQGMDSLVVAKLLGHTSTRMVEKVYGQLADANFVAAIAALPRLKLAS